MNPLALFPSSWLLPAVGIVVALMLAALGVQTVRLGAAEAETAKVSETLANERASAAMVSADASESARRKEKRRTAAIEGAVANAQTQTSTLAAARPAAAAAGSGLRERTAAVAARCSPAASDSAAAQGSAPATRPGDLLADVSGRLEAAGRELAATATERGIAGTACVKSYDALKD